MRMACDGMMPYDATAPFCAACCTWEPLALHCIACLGHFRACRKPVRTSGPLDRWMMCHSYLPSVPLAVPLGSPPPHRGRRCRQQQCLTQASLLRRVQRSRMSCACLPADAQPVSSFNFPPGLLPKLVREKNTRELPYTPLMSEEIEAEGETRPRTHASTHAYMHACMRVRPDPAGHAAACGPCTHARMRRSRMWGAARRGPLLLLPLMAAGRLVRLPPAAARHIWACMDVDAAGGALCARRPAAAARQGRVPQVAPGALLRRAQGLQAWHDARGAGRAGLCAT